MDRFQQHRRRSKASSDVEKFYINIQQVQLLIQELQEWMTKLKNKQAEIVAVPICNDNRNQHLEEINAHIKSHSEVIRSKLKGIEKSFGDSEPKRRSRLNSAFSTKVERVELQSLGPDGQGQGRCSNANVPPDLESGSGSGVRFSLFPKPQSSQSQYIPAHIRIRKNQHQALLRQFRDIITEYQTTQVKYRDQMKRRLKRQLEITSMSIPDEQIDTMIDKGNIKVFTKSIIFDQKMVEDIHSRHHDLLRLEKSIKDLNELFKDLALHIEAQGAIVDNIERNLATASEYIADGNRKVALAFTHHDKYKKKKRLLLLLILLILLILMGVALGIILSSGRGS